MTRSLAGTRRAEATALPSWAKPQLTKLVDQPPEGPEWLHEIKMDGYRMHARLDRGAVRLLTRTGLDWTHKYPAIAAAIVSLPARQAYLDGELCEGGHCPARAGAGRLWAGGGRRQGFEPPAPDSRRQCSTCAAYKIGDRNIGKAALVPIGEIRFGPTGLLDVLTASLPWEGTLKEVCTYRIFSPACARRLPLVRRK